MTTNPKISLIRTGSACWQQEDPEFTREWLLQKHQLHSEFHPEIQAWLTPKQRAEIFLESILNDQYDVLWSLRGGEGSPDVLPYLHEHAAKIAQAKPKLLIGFSDFTAVLNYFNQIYHWPVAHGPGVVRLARDKVSAETTQQTLAFVKNATVSLSIQDLTPLNSAAQESKVIHAECCGGNLSLLAISVKDSWEIQTTNKIVIIEEINEKAHKVSALLNYLRRINLLNHPKAIIFGEFIYENNPEHQAAIQKTLKRFADACRFPVLQSLTFGHGKNNLVLPFFREAKIQLGTVYELVYN